MPVRRVKTGVDGLDLLINGGFPENSTILVSGSPGTGKSILGLQHLYYGAMNGENGLYITFEQNREDLLKQAKEFGWDLDKLEKQGKINIVSMWPHDFHEVLTVIRKYLAMKPKRLVIDSITSAIIDNRENRELAHNIIKHLKETGLTSILTSELLKEQKGLSRDGVSEFVCDGVIIMEKEVVGKRVERVLRVEKMRNTKIDGGNYHMEISSKGIVVKE